jgi:hypothetical protein
LLFKEHPNSVDALFKISLRLFSELEIRFAIICSNLDFY